MHHGADWHYTILLFCFFSCKKEVGLHEDTVKIVRGRDGHVAVFSSAGVDNNVSGR